MKRNGKRLSTATAFAFLYADLSIFLFCAVDKAADIAEKFRAGERFQQAEIKRRPIVAVGGDHRAVAGDLVPDLDGFEPVVIPPVPQDGRLCLDDAEAQPPADILVGADLDRGRLRKALPGKAAPLRDQPADEPGIICRVGIEGPGRVRLRRIAPGAAAVALEREALRHGASAL